MSDSEESDGEGGLGNLSRLIIRPPGHSGKAKRGHLCFDAAFECGNLGRADHVTELEYDLFIRPDTCRPRARFWFNFTVENIKQDQRVIFNFVNFGKERTLYNTEMTPIVRSTSRNKWQRIPRRLLFYHRSPQHHNRRILSLAFAFDREEDVYHFAAAVPYSYSRLQRHLAAWEKKAQGQCVVDRECIAETIQKRRIEVMTIGDMSLKQDENKDIKEDYLNKGKVQNPKKRIVLIIARVHGGEPPASFICQGFLDFMISSSEKAGALRDGIVVKVIPMLNPDGVFLGSQRSDLLGSDMNRCWGRATTFQHPPLIAVNDMIKKIMAEKTLQLDFIIDIHSDISHEGVFVRGNSYDNIYRFERHAVLPKFLSQRIEAWRPENCFYNADASAAGTARRTLPAANVDAYTLLASLGGRRLSPKGQYMHYTDDAYFKIGRSLAKALCDYYRYSGVIPPREGLSKKKENCARRRRKRPVVEKDRSPSTDRERRALVGRVVSPALPLASPPPPRAPPRHLSQKTMTKTAPELQPLLPVITGVSVRTPRLTVVDLSSYIRSPGTSAPPRIRRRPAPRITRARRTRNTSDEYDTVDSDT